MDLAVHLAVDPAAIIRVGCVDDRVIRVILPGMTLQIVGHHLALQLVVILFFKKNNRMANVGKFTENASLRDRVWE